jgi:hypothetical protein
MAGLTSQGIGSGLDVAGLVAKLVAAEKAPRQSQITRADQHRHHHFRTRDPQGRDGHFQ